jgi:hypothetical protein
VARRKFSSGDYRENLRQCLVQQATIKMVDLCGTLARKGGS